MTSKKALGRGLGAFFPDYDEGSAGNLVQQKSADKQNIYLDPQKRVNVILQVPVQNVRANRHQPRREFNEKRLQELSRSIKRHGLIQPITVQYIGEKRFELISGERRLRAAKMAELEKLPAYVREVNDEEIVSFALIENIQREDLNPMEVALGYKRLVDELDNTQEQVAEKVGKNRSTVANMLRLLNLPPYVQAALRDKEISVGHARALITIDEEKDQKRIFDDIIKKEYSVRQTEHAVRELDKLHKTEEPQKSSAANETNEHDYLYKEISARLHRKLNTKVQLKSRKKGGEIRIEFYSDDELERLLDIFDTIS